MKMGFSNRFLIALFAVVTLAIAGSAGAAPRDFGDDPTTQRLEIDTYLADLEMAMGRVLESEFAQSVAVRARLEPARQLALARRELVRMSDSDVAAVAAALRSSPALAELPQSIDAIYAPPVRQRLRAGTDAVSAACSPGSGTPLGITDVYIAKGVSLAAELVIEALPTDLLSIVARLIPVAAYGAAQTAVLVLEGLNAVEAECLTAKFEEAVANFQMTTTNILNDGSRWTSDADLSQAVGTVTANDNANRATITTNDNSNRDAIIAAITAGTTRIVDNDNANTRTIVANDNSNRSTIINNDNSNRDTVVANDNANRDLMVTELRALGCDIIRLLNTPEGQRSSELASCQAQAGFPYSFPERKLGSGNSATAAFVQPVFSPAAPPPDRANVLWIETALLDQRLVPSYYLPRSRGGLVEQVRQHVWNTIEAQTQLAIAPRETVTARTHALAADALLEAGRYLDAYRTYSTAFRTLVPVAD